jgi:putative serine protease PepD
VRLTGARPDTPAERAGLQAGDRIVAFDGKTVRNLEDYSLLLFSHRPGDTITVTIQRGAETLQLTAVLEGRPGDN